MKKLQLKDISQYLPQGAKWSDEVLHITIEPSRFGYDYEPSPDKEMAIRVWTKKTSHLLRWMPRDVVLVTCEREIVMKKTRPYEGCVGIVFDELFEKICQALGVPEEFIVNTPENTIRVKKELPV